MSVTITFAPDSVILPSPQLGDSLTHKNDSRINRSMNGTLWITKTAIPKIVNWNFNTVQRIKIKELENFLRIHKGETFTITDHHANVYTAKVTAEFSSNDSSRGSGCSNPADGDFSLILERIT